MKSGHFLISLLFVLSVTGTFLRPSYDFGFALQFSGNQFVDFPPSQIGAPFSIEFQLRPTASAAGTILEFGGSGNTNFQVALSNNRSIQFTTTRTNGQPSSFVSNIPLALGEYSYVVITVDGVGVARIFIETPNGNGVVTSTTSGNVFAPLFCGRPNGILGCNLNRNGCMRADITSLIIWRRVLDPVEFSRFKALTGFESGLVALWSFDEGTGLVTRDISPSRLTASLGGGNINRAPLWIVHGYVSTSHCKLWGDPRAINFDDQNLNIQNSGRYSFALSKLDSSINIEVQIDAKPNKVDSSSVVGLALKVGNDTVIFDLDFINQRDSRVFLNGQRTSTEFALPSGLVVTRRDQRNFKHFYDVTLPFVFHLRIRALPQSLMTNLRLRVPRFTKYIGNMETNSVCGNLNNNQDEAIPTPLNGDGLFAGVLPRIFTSVISQAPCPIGNLVDPLRTLALSSCNNPAVVDPILASNCLTDVCVTGDISAAEFYADLTFQNCLEAAASNSSIVCPRTCPGFCNLQGTCDTNTGICSCFAGFIGNDCSQQKSFACYSASWPLGNITMTPFTSTANVVQHYGLDGLTYGSSNTGLEVADSSIVYLYQQSGLARGASTAPNPALSLVVINDQFWSGTSGSAQLNFSYTGPNRALISTPVRNSPFDLYISNLATTGNLTALWNWWQCCTSGMAFSNLPLNDTFCMNLNLTARSGLFQSFLLEPNQFGAADLQSIPLRSTGMQNLRICGTTCTNKCGEYTNCSTCTADPSCGWCLSTDSCEPGNALGPTQGRCSSWRFSNQDSVSRVFSNTPDFPVDPSNTEVYIAPNQGLNVNFFVNFPASRTVPLQLQLLVDLSTSASPTLCFVQSLISPLFDRIRTVHPSSSLSVASFVDKPLLPFGSPTRDWVYQQHVPFTENQNVLQQVASKLVPGFGGDSANAQLEALLTSAANPTSGWTPGKRHVIVMIALTPFHVSTDTSLPPNNGDGILNGEPPGSTENYPTIPQLKEALLKTNIVPVFIVPDRLVSSYVSLINNLGFGLVGRFTPSSRNTFYATIIEALNIISKYATAQILEPGLMTARVVTPAAGYFGVSPNSRGVFTASFPAQPTPPATLPRTVLVVPGYSSITIQPRPSDAPIAGPCPDVTIDLNAASSGILQFSGSSTYPEPITILVTPPPSFQGVLFQFFGGVAGDVISQPNTAITDPLGRVIFVPNSNNFAGRGTSNVSFRVVDDCNTFTQTQVCPITVIGNQRPIASPNPIFVNISQDGVANITLSGQTFPPGDFDPIVVRLPNRGSLTDALGLAIVPRAPLNNPSLPLPQRITVTYRPIPGTAGQPPDNFYSSFAYKIRDSQGLESDEVVVNIFVNPPVIVPPLALPLAASVAQDSSTTIVLRSADPLSRTVSSFTISTAPSNGILRICSVCPPISVFPTTVASPLIEYVPNPGIFGSDSFEYRVTVNDPVFGELLSAAVTVSVIIVKVNVAPTLNVISLSARENATTNFTFSVTDDDPVSALSVFICAFSGAGTLTNFDGSALAVGDKVTDALLRVRYVAPLLTALPPANPFATIEARVNDPFSFGGCTLAASITLTPINHPPTAASASVSVTQFQLNSITLIGNDIDQEIVTFFICTLPAFGNLTNLGNNTPLVANSQISTNSFQPPTQTVATVTFRSSTIGQTSFTYRTRDAAGNFSVCTTVTVDVQVNPSPATVDDPSPFPVILDENTNLLITLRGTDDFDRAISFRIDVVPSRGKLFQVDANNSPTSPILNGDIVTSALNNIFFVPDANTFGAQYTSFAVSALNGVSASVSRVFNVEVVFVNTNPVAFSGSFSGNQDNDIFVTLTGSDLETNQTNLRFSVASLPASSLGTLFACISNGSGCTIPVIANTVLPSPFLKFTPLAAQFGTTTFTFNVIDADNGQSTLPATVTITVNFVNVVPSANGVTSVTVTDKSDAIVVVDLTGNDPDNLPAPLTSVICQLPKFGRLFHFDGSVIGASIDTVNVVVPSGQVAYSSNGIQNPSNINPFTSFAYKVNDGIADSSDHVIDVNVTHIALPIATPVDISGLEDNDMPFKLSGSDPNNANAVLTFVFVSLPDPAVGTVVGAVVGIPTSNSSFVFTPVSNVNGNFPSFKYLVISDGIQSGTADISINISPVNDPPLAAMTNPVLPQFATSIFVLDGIDVDGDNLNAFVTLSPSFFKGTLFQVDINDNPTSTVIPANNIRILVTNPQRKVAFRPLNSLTDFGIDYSFFSYILQDPTLATSQETVVSITVFPPPTAPIPDPNSVVARGDNDKPVALKLLFTDVNSVFTGEVAVGNILTLPARGTLFVEDLLTPVVLNTDTAKFTSSSTFFFATATLFEFGNPYTNFTWSATDGVLTSSVQTTNIIIDKRVLPPDPSATVTSYSGIENGNPVTITLTAVDRTNNDTLITTTGQDFRFIIRTLPTKGTLLDTTDTFVGGGQFIPITSVPYTIRTSIIDLGWTLRYTPILDQNTFGAGPDTFTFTVGQNVGGEFIETPNPTTISVTLTAVNSRPLLVLPNQGNSTLTGLAGGFIWVGTSSNLFSMNLGPIVLNDDARSTDTVRLAISVSADPNNRLGKLLVAGQAQATSYVITNTRSTIDSILASGITFTPAPFTSGTGDCPDACITITVTFSDLGSFGQIGTAQFNTTLNFGVAINDANQLDANAFPSWPASAGLVGFTSALSMTVTGVYQVLKKRKILPEAADPWENDEFFDATTNSPLTRVYSMSQVHVMDDS